MEVGRRGWDPSDPEPCPQAQPPQPGGTQTCSLRNEGANPTLCCQLSPVPEAAAPNISLGNPTRLQPSEDPRPGSEGGPGTGSDLHKCRTL